MNVDRSRHFALPDIRDLSKDQEEALALPLHGQHLIVGGPGTGKSIIVLLRARRLAAEGKKYRLLVYNHTLDSANRQLFGKKHILAADTWMHWFSTEYYRHFHKDVPKEQQEGKTRFLPIDWEAVKTAFSKAKTHQAPSSGENFFLLIDEGQDMPPAFYKTLIDWGIENFYIAADQNQKLEPEQCSSRRDIKTILCIRRPLELTSNFRNSRPIALLAQHFRPDDPASPKPALPQETPSARTPVLMRYDSLDNIACRLLKLSDRHPKKLIGIITPDTRVRLNFFNALGAAKPALDNGRPPVQTYPTDARKKLDFTHGGIMVITAQSCKGLEFDITVLADIDRHHPKDDEYLLKSRFYVMASRAREQLVLLRDGTPDPAIEKLLPPENSPLLVRTQT